MINVIGPSHASDDLYFEEDEVQLSRRTDRKRVPTIAGVTNDQPAGLFSGVLGNFLRSVFLEFTHCSFLSWRLMCRCNLLLGVLSVSDYAAMKTKRRHILVERV